MTEAIETEIIDTGPINDGVSAVSTEGMAADLAAELAAEDAAKAEAAAKVEAKAAKEPSKSIDEALEKAMAKAQAKADSQSGEKVEEVTDPKGESDDSKQEEKPKAQRGADGKFASPVKEAGNAGGEDTAKNAQSEGEFLKVPSRLLPSERDHWGNVPHTVKRAIHRLEADFAAQAETHRDATEFSESLRQFREMATAAKTTVPEALGRYVEVDKMLANDFGRGMAHIAQSHGKNPTAAVAEFMRAAGVHPQQLGAYLQGQPAPQQAQQQQRPVDPQVSQLQQELAQMRQYMQQQQADAQAQRERAEAEEARKQYIAPYEQQYGELWAEMKPIVAKYYNSDIIDPSLSPDVRLREAVYEAERKVAPLRPSPALEADPDTEGKVTPLPRKKQISGSPVASTRSNVKKGPAPSIDEALANAFRNSTR